jgi:hypothetical protein
MIFKIRLELIIAQEVAKFPKFLRIKLFNFIVILSELLRYFLFIAQNLIRLIIIFL